MTNMKHEIQLIHNFFTNDLSDIWDKYLTESVGSRYSVANNQIVRDYIKVIRTKTYDFIKKHRYGIKINEEGTDNWNKEDYFCSVDLVDGTSSLLLGTPLFGSQFAIFDNGRIDEVFVFIPTEYKLAKSGFYYAKRNKGSFSVINSEIIQLSVSQVTDLKKSTIAFDGPTKDVAKLYSNPIVNKVTRVRNFSAFCWAGTRLIRGRNIPTSIDAVIGVKNKPWDHVPYVLLTEEAGGKVTNLKGTDDLGDYSNILFSNGYLHEYIINYIYKQE